MAAIGLQNDGSVKRLAFTEDDCRARTLFSEWLIAAGASIRIVSDFVAPARIGDWLEGRGEVVKATKSVVFARGHLNVEGRTILTASGNYKLQGHPHSGD